MYLNPYYRHIQDIKREFVRGITPQHINALREMLFRKAMAGNMEAFRLYMQHFNWQNELDESSDAKHELNMIMGSPTDGVMKSLRPGSIGISKETKIENKKQA